MGCSSQGALGHLGCGPDSAARLCDHGQVPAPLWASVACSSVNEGRIGLTGTWAQEEQPRESIDRKPLLSGKWQVQPAALA